MNKPPLPPLPARPAPLRAAAFAALLWLSPLAAVAGPGAHGPNGEHLDAPTATATVSALPRLQASTEAFELVAELKAAELVILVDRYNTNEPVLGAQLEVESGALKAVARYRAEQGDYVVTDAALLKALAAPGEHALVFTLMAGADGDLLDGTLVTAAGGAASPGAAANAHADGRGHAHQDELLERAAWLGGGIALVGLFGATAWWRQRRRETPPLQGGLS